MHWRRLEKGNENWKINESGLWKHTVVVQRSELYSGWEQKELELYDSFPHDVNKAHSWNPPGCGFVWFEWIA